MLRSSACCAQLGGDAVQFPAALRRMDCGAENFAVDAPAGREPDQVAQAQRQNAGERPGEPRQTQSQRKAAWIGQQLRD